MLQEGFIIVIGIYLNRVILFILLVHQLSNHLFVHLQVILQLLILFLQLFNLAFHLIHQVLQVGQLGILLLARDCQCLCSQVFFFVVERVVSRVLLYLIGNETEQLLLIRIPTV